MRQEITTFGDRKAIWTRSPVLLVAIAPDATLQTAGSVQKLSNAQEWPYVSGVARFWGDAAAGKLQAPTIAVVDSGVDATRADFGGGRVVKQVSFTSLAPNAAGDGY